MTFFLYRGNVYGQDAPECADTLFLYGQALYETAVVRNSLLGEEALKSTVEVKESESPTGKSFIEIIFLIILAFLILNPYEYIYV